jgi:hypothetical protein
MQKTSGWFFGKFGEMLLRSLYQAKNAKSWPRRNTKTGRSTEGPIMRVYSTVRSRSTPIKKHLLLQEGVFLLDQKV